VIIVGKRDYAWSEMPEIVGRTPETMRYRFPGDGAPHPQQCSCARCKRWRHIDWTNGHEAPVEMDARSAYTRKVSRPGYRPPFRSPLTLVATVADIDVGTWWRDRGVTELHVYRCEHGRQTIMPPEWAVNGTVRCLARYSQAGSLLGCDWIGGTVAGLDDAAQQTEAWYRQWRAGEPRRKVERIRAKRRRRQVDGASG
jgi:hypothetical protein